MAEIGLKRIYQNTQQAGFGSQAITCLPLPWRNSHVPEEDGASFDGTTQRAEPRCLLTSGEVHFIYLAIYQTNIGYLK